MSLVNDQLHISNTLEEKVDVFECDTYPSLKPEIENLKEQITHLTYHPVLFILIQVMKGKFLESN